MPTIDNDPLANINLDPGLYRRDVDLVLVRAVFYAAGDVVTVDDAVELDEDSQLVFMVNGEVARTLRATRQVMDHLSQTSPGQLTADHDFVALRLEPLAIGSKPGSEPHGSLLEHLLGENGPDFTCADALPALTRIAAERTPASRRKDGTVTTILAAFRVVHFPGDGREMEPDDDVSLLGVIDEVVLPEDRRLRLLRKP